MNREHAIAVLRDHERELRAFGVVSASLFGSVARNAAGPDSDVDIAVRLGDNFSAGGFDYFSCLEGLEKNLSSMLGCKADVIEEPVRKERIQSEIDADRAIVF